MNREELQKIKQDASFLQFFSWFISWTYQKIATMIQAAANKATLGKESAVSKSGC